MAKVAQVVVMGAGIGGVSAAYELRERLGDGHQVTLVGEGPRFSFTPSNPWVALGRRKADDVSFEVGPFLKRKGIAFNAMGVERVACDRSVVRLRGGHELPYDYLLVATGPRLAFDEVPGLGPDAHTQSVCTTPHAAQAWDAYQRLLEDPGPVVVGAAAGASCFGPAYEYVMMVDTDLRKRRLRDRVPITFVTSEPYLGHMGLGGVGDSRGMMEHELRSREIKFITNARITAVRDGAMDVAEVGADGAVTRTQALDFRYAMVLPAFTGVDAVREVDGLCNPRGFVLIDAHQRNPRYPNVYAVGVCVAIPPVEATPVPTGAPKTGYMIESMVSAAVENIAAEIEGRPATATATWNAICLADTGDAGFAFVALPQLPPRNVAWARAGRWVHLAKIAFEKYFLRKVRKGNTEPVYERYVLKALGITRLKP